MMNVKIQSFPYSANRDARVLILGSMPGVESLKQQQYYAHPRNLFWNFMNEFFGAARELPYERRLEILRENRGALWDVAYSCRREGSLDSNMTDVKPNQFKKLFAFAPEIHTIFFNGQTAAALFKKLVPVELTAAKKLITLPSTSPANASITLGNKLAAWRQVLL